MELAQLLAKPNDFKKPFSAKGRPFKTGGGEGDAGQFIDPRAGQLRGDKNPFDGGIWMSESCLPKKLDRQVKDATTDDDTVDWILFILKS